MENAIQRVGRIKRPEPKCTTGVVFIHWGIDNKVAFGVAFFEDGKMVEFKADYKIVEKVLKAFIPSVGLWFVKSIPSVLNGALPTERYWNFDLHINQNGILRFERTRICAYLKPEQREGLFKALTK